MSHVSTVPCFLVKVVTSSPQIELLSGSHVLRTVWLSLVLMAGGYVSMLVSALQRNRANRRYITYVRMYLFIILAHTVMEAKMSRPRGVNSIILVQI